MAAGAGRNCAPATAGIIYWPVAQVIIHDRLAAKLERVVIKIDVLDRQFFNVSPHSSTVERFLDMEEAAGATPAVGTIFVVSKGHQDGITS